jgi:hypothetical protein
MNFDKRGPALQRVVFVFFCFLPVACGSSPPEVHPVFGEVFLNGQPASGAVVHFHPLDDEECSPAFATVKEDGSFELSTYANNDGAEVGEYRVTLVWCDETQEEERETVYGPDRFGDRYSNPKTSGLIATVGPGENIVPRFDINGTVQNDG